MLTYILVASKKSQTFPVLLVLRKQIETYEIRHIHQFKTQTLWTFDFI